MSGLNENYLTLLYKTGNDKAMYKCVCGVEKEIRISSVISRGTISCGCYRKTYRVTHGMTKTPEYKTWSGIKNRCSNPKTHNAHRYYGRGISVSKRWDKFENFLEDMGKRPSPIHSIDRINNDLGYYPENCKWSTPREQAINRGLRIDNSTGISGVNWHKYEKKWSVRFVVNGKRKTLGYFDDIEKAIKCRKEAEQKYWKTAVEID